VVSTAASSRRAVRRTTSDRRSAPAGGRPGRGHEVVAADLHRDRAARDPVVAQPPATRVASMSRWRCRLAVSTTSRAKCPRR
jgi:hypothetical protein